MQAAADEIIVACALERFYLDHQSYPGDLRGLVPAYLEQIPHDVVTGGPLRYAPTPDGRYRLWEVGWNGRDEGGVVAWNKEGKRLDEKQGDWVWQYQALTPPSKPSS